MIQAAQGICYQDSLNHKVSGGKRDVSTSEEKRKDRPRSIASPPLRFDD